MSFHPRAACALVLIAVLGLAQAQQGPLATERDKIGYMIGMDVAHSLGPAMPDMDLDAFQKALQNGMAGKTALLDDADAKKTSQALMVSIGARKAGKPAPVLDRQNVGYLLGADIGRNLAPVRGEFDMPMLLKGLTDAAGPNTRSLLSDADARLIRTALSARIQAAKQGEASALGQANRRAGAEFMAGNKNAKGVFSTPSGLQYMVLRQGDGVRPKPGERVRVNYVGTLLDGTKFDSSYDRGQPAVFGLNQVIAGWSQGVGMMPIGAKYRFWIPGELAYGESGGGDGVIGPNATLVFDIELLGVE